MDSSKRTVRVHRVRCRRGEHFNEILNGAAMGNSRTNELLSHGTYGDGFGVVPTKIGFAG